MRNDFNLGAISGIFSSIVSNTFVKLYEKLFKNFEKEKTSMTFKTSPGSQKLIAINL